MKLIIILLLTLTTFCFSQDFWKKTNHDGGVSALSINLNGEIFAAIWADGTFRSTDNGDSWTKLNDSPTATSFAINSNGDIFAGEDYDGGIFRSTDNGNSWTQTNDNLSVTSLAINSNGDIFAGTPGSVFRSTDNGDNWTPINEGLSFPGNLQHYIILDVSPNGDIFALVAGGWTATIHIGIYRSTDNGDSWTQIHNGLPEFGQGCIAKCLVANRKNGNILLGTGDGIYRSTDNGNSWIQLNRNNLTEDCITSLAINSDGKIFVASYYNSGSGVFSSNDNGDTWIEINEGLADFWVNCLGISPNGYIYAGTDGGLFRSINTTVLVEEENKIPSEYALSQNYPNPFNPSTTINYSIPKQSYVTLKIFDVLGRELRTLINKEQPQGNYEVEFDASNLTSGIYFYRIQAGQFVETRKMILMK